MRHSGSKTSSEWPKPLKVQNLVYTDSSPIDPTAKANVFHVLGSRASFLSPSLSLPLNKKDVDNCGQKDTGNWKKGAVTYCGCGPGD